MEKIIEAYLHEHIPLSKAMGISVKYASENKIILRAPLAPNINHKHTVFGGSLHAVATLACWSLLYANLKEIKQAQLVITKSDVSYLAPVQGDFEAVCLLPEDGSWERFLKIFQAKGKSRINLTASILYDNRQAVDYRGTFAALT